MTRWVRALFHREVLIPGAVLFLCGLSTGHLWAAFALPFGVLAVAPLYVWLDRRQHG